jgi:hypothetical protein
VNGAGPTGPVEAAAEAAWYGMAGDDAPASLEALARDIQCRLWGRLQDARNRAVNRSWSMECGWIVQEIAQLIHFVGPTSWGEVPVFLIEAGLYDAIVGATEVDYERPDMVEVAKTRESILSGRMSGGW